MLTLLYPSGFLSPSNGMIMETLLLNIVRFYLLFEGLERPESQLNGLKNNIRTIINIINNSLFKIKGINMAELKRYC